MKTFGRAIAIQTEGLDAVEDFDKSLAQARDMLAKNISESMRACHYLGYDIDAASVVVDEEQRGDVYVLSYTMKGRQRVRLLRRLWKAVRA
jgi:hypothetical protein